MDLTHAFDGLIKGLLLIGIAIGLAACGLLWLAYTIASHLSISWIY